MTTIELQQWRESFVERYLNKIDDMEISEELERAAKKIFSKRRTPRPCVIHSQEEMIAEVRKSVEDAREGRVTSSEDLDKEIDGSETEKSILDSQGQRRFERNYEVL